MRSAAPPAGLDGAAFRATAAASLTVALVAAALLLESACRTPEEG